MVWGHGSTLVGPILVHWVFSLILQMAGGHVNENRNQVPEAEGCPPVTVEDRQSIF